MTLGSRHHPMPPLGHKVRKCGLDDGKARARLLQALRLPIQCLRYCAEASSSNARDLVKAVDKVFNTWRRLFNGHTELPIPRKPYLLDDRGLTLRSGICQIRAYAKETESAPLIAALNQVQELLKAAKTEFFGLLTDAEGLAYFGAGKKKAAAVSAPKGNESSKKNLAG